MATLLVHSANGDHRLMVQDGQSVRDALDTTQLRVRAACGGAGSCGACAVRLLNGAVNPPTLTEYQKLDPDERAAGERLACQLRLGGDAEIILDHPAPPSCWKSITPENLMAVEGARPDLDRHIYGIAVDLGTTHIRVALWDRKHGRRIATRQGLNPQAIFGADVLNRLAASQTSSERARELATLARTAILEAVRDILARDVGEVTPMLAEIGRMVIVGNTAMLALLTGQGGSALVTPENWQRTIDYCPADTAIWQFGWHMPNAEIVIPASLAGFVGSDLLADLIAMDFTKSSQVSLLLDIGSNIEIALWDGHCLHVTSVPGAPAFEGGGIRYGMPAESGAIYRVRHNGGDFECKVIGNGPAKGFCGSGLVDGIAALLAAGLLKASGRFTTQIGGRGLALDPTNPHTTITGCDVDAFQRAKAATAAAMTEMLTLAGKRWIDVRRLCVCGAFGHTLDLGHAQRVGLLPSIAPHCIELAADATLAGCERALLATDGDQLFSELSKTSTVYNLSFIEGHEDRYIDHLRLSPLPSTA